MTNSNCIIITQKEWLNWLAFGYLRVSPSRISYFDYTECGFDKLMSYSVDNALDEEDAYLIASLVNDYSREELHVKRTQFSDYISIQAVQGFYTLSAKGNDLLEHEAGQSNSILNYDSKIENLWNEWKNTQFRLRSHDKGNKFLEVLEYQKFEVEPEIDDDTLFSQILKNYTRRNLHSKLQDRHKRSSFAWLVINQEFNEKIGKSLYRKYHDFRKNNQNVEIQDISKTYKFLEDSFITNDSDSLFDYPLLIAEKSYFEKWHSDNSEFKEHYLASTILVHYYNILESNYDINLLSLSKDLTLLDKHYSTYDFSRKIAYYIGRKSDEGYLNYLYIAKNIDEEKPGMFDPNFFYNLKKEKLTLCNIDQAQLQDTINKVNFIAEEIQLAYKIEVNKVQDPEIGSDAIGDRDLNQSIQSQASMTDSDNSETNNNPTENLYTTGNTTNDNSTQPRSEAQKLADSEESEDSTNRIGDSNQSTQSQKPMENKDNIKTNKIPPTEKLDIPSNTTNDDSTQHYSETQKPADSEESEYNTKDMDNPDEIESNTKPSNLSTTTNNENETIKHDQVQEGEQMSLSMESTTEKHTPINPTELLRDALSIISELPKGKEKNGEYFRDLLFSKNVQYKNEFKNLKSLTKLFEAFDQIVGNDMNKHTRFDDFKKELLSNSNIHNK